MIEVLIGIANWILAHPWLSLAAILWVVVMLQAARLKVWRERYWELSRMVDALVDPEDARDYERQEREYERFERSLLPPS